MRAYDLEKIEAGFKQNLRDAYGKTWTASPGEFPNSLVLKTTQSSNFFYNQKVVKEKIAQHLTHGILTADIGALSQPNNHVSVSYVVARDGTIYQLFPDDLWSYHLGPTSSAPNTTWSSRSIGIEASNIGPLVEDVKDSNVLNDTYGKPYCLKSDNQFYKACDYRGYKYFATLTDAQYNAIDSLVLNLCRKHKLPFTKADPKVAYDYCGGVPSTTYYFHSNVRKDKVDCSPVFDLSRINGE